MILRGSAKKRIIPLLGGALNLTWATLSSLTVDFGAGKALAHPSSISTVKFYIYYQVYFLNYAEQIKGGG